MNPELIVKASLDIGAAMLQAGAETIRVEDTISRICRSYYKGNLDVTSYLSAVFVTMEVTDWDEHSGCPLIVTQHRRVSSVSNDLNKLEELNALSRYVCEHTPEPSEIDTRLQTILTTKASTRKVITGHIFATFAFTIFFGGTVLDAFCCACISVLMYFAARYLTGRLNNELIHYFILSFITGLPACLLELSPIPTHMDMIMIGAVMLLIPGIALTNSLRDLLTGDIVSVSIKLLNSLLLAVAIAMGFALAMVITGV